MVINQPRSSEVKIPGSNPAAATLYNIIHEDVQPLIRPETQISSQYGSEQLARAEGDSSTLVNSKWWPKKK